MKKMKNRKSLRLAVALAISSIPLVNPAEANIYIGANVGDDYTVNASADAYPNTVGHAFGIYTNGGDASTVTSAGDRLTLITSGQAADGIRSNPGGQNNWQDARGIINVGDNLKISVSGISADGLNINGSTVVHIGKDAKINTSYNGVLVHSDGEISEGAHAVRANFHATINIGDGLKAGTLGESSHAVYAAHGRSLTNNPTDGSKINIGNGAVLSTVGNGSHTVMMGSENGKVVIGKGANMTTAGKGSHGVAAYADTSGKGGGNGTVKIGARSTISTSVTALMDFLQMRLVRFCLWRTMWSSQQKEMALMV